MPTDRVAALVVASGLDTELSFEELDEIVSAGVALAVQAAFRIHGATEDREDVATLRAIMTREIIDDVMLRADGTWSLAAAAASDCGCPDCEHAREVVPELVSAAQKAMA